MNQIVTDSNMNDGHADKLAAAEALATQVLQAEPGNAEARHALGLIRMRQGRWPEAVALLQAARDSDPARSDYARNLVHALNGLAKTETDGGAFEAARLALQQVLSYLPGDADYLCRMSFVLTRMGRPHEGLAAAQLAAKAAPEGAEPEDKAGLTYLGLGKTVLAIKAFEKALEKDPDYAAALIKLGNAFLQAGAADTAIAYYDQAILRDAGNAQAFSNLGLAYAAQFRFADAEGAFRRAIAADPDFPEAHFNLSRILLMQGDYEDGWSENEWRWKCPDFPSSWRQFPYPHWQGEALAGRTILVWSEQGIGDEIMFANPIPDLLEGGAKLVLECNERLAPVFQRSFPGAVVVPRLDPPDPRIAAAGIDFQAPLASLCTYYRTSKKSFANNTGKYLVPDPERSEELRQRYCALRPGLIVGICWRSGNPIVGHERSAPLPLWREILTRAGCNFISLQYGETAEDIEAARIAYGADIYVDVDDDPLQNAEDWFAQVAAMDLVISVDNSTIQVSGSQGIPTFTLLSHAPEWRFGLAGEDHDTGIRPSASSGRLSRAAGTTSSKVWRKPSAPISKAARLNAKVQ
jgi:tetratricopeptide (TPR) repeat protein